MPSPRLPAALLLLASIAPAAAQSLDLPQARHVVLSHAIAGLLHLPHEVLGRAVPPVVILLGDAGGQDGRPALYIPRLLDSGFAVLEADFSETAVHDGGLQAPEATQLAARLPLALDALGPVAGIDATRMAALGLGEGARALLGGPPDALRSLSSAVLVAPGCDGPLAELAQRHRRQADAATPPILLVHGDLDLTEALACASVQAALGGLAAGTARLSVEGAGFGWDAASVTSGRVMLSDPAAPDRHRQASPDLPRALLALERMLIFLIRTTEERRN